MGDTVNVASRLEGVNKSYGTKICASEETVRQAAWSEKRELDLVRVPGRANPLKLFELWGENEAPAPATQATYAEGLALYRNRQFARASAAFQKASSLGDHPCAGLMAARATQMGLTPPPNDWDGAWNIEKK